MFFLWPDSQQNSIYDCNGFYLSTVDSEVPVFFLNLFINSIVVDGDVCTLSL